MNGFFFEFFPYRHKYQPGGWCLWFGRKTPGGGFIARLIAIELPTKPTRRQMRKLHKQYKAGYAEAKNLLGGVLCPS